MKAFTKITAIVAPLDRSNVDTDAIIPKQFLKLMGEDESLFLQLGVAGKPEYPIGAR